MTVDENVAAVRDFVERAWNAGDESVFEEHLAPDFGGPGGRERFKLMVLGFRAAFADFRLDVHDMFGVDDIAIDVLRGDKRVAGWAQIDRFGLLQQLS